jgi:predicted transcriptional regulator
LEDYLSLLLLSSSAFFVILSLGLLYRYKQVSSFAASAADIGRNLWFALEATTKKQDERIVDLMARVEVLQSKLHEGAQQSVGQGSVGVRKIVSGPASTTTSPRPEGGDMNQASPAVESVTQSQQEVTTSQLNDTVSQTFQSQPALDLDNTHKVALGILRDGPLDTMKIRKVLSEQTNVSSREHTARVMKQLFEMGLVSRSDQRKPFTYELTDEGRKHIG